MEIETFDKPTKYMSFLSEDDEETNKLEPSRYTQEYISPVKLNKPSSNYDKHKSQTSDRPLSSTIHFTTTAVLQQTLSSPEEDLSSNNTIETISENIQDSLLNKEDRSTPPINILDSNRTQIVLRLLHVLTQVPVPLKPLRLVRRRIQQKKILQQQTTVSTDKIDAMVTETPVHVVTSEPSKLIEEVNLIVNDTPQTQVEEQPKSVEQMDTTTNDTPIVQDSLSIEDQSNSTIEMNPPINNTSEAQDSLAIEDQPKFITKTSSPMNDTPESQVSLALDDQPKLTKESDLLINSPPETQVLFSTEEHPKLSNEIGLLINDTPETQASFQTEEKIMSIEEANTTINNTPETQGLLRIEDQSKSTEEVHVEINEEPEIPISTSIKNLVKSNEKKRETRHSKPHEEQQAPVEKYYQTRHSEQYKERQTSVEKNSSDGKLNFYNYI